MKNKINIKDILKFGVKTVFYIDNPEDIVNLTAKLPVSITEITPENVANVNDFRNIEVVHTFKEYLRLNQHGVYAWLDSKVVGHAWAILCKRSHCLANGYMDIYKGEAFIHFVNVSEKYRGQNIFPAMLSTLCNKLFLREKVDRIIIDTEDNNESSQRGITKVGFKLLGREKYVQLWGRLLMKCFIYSNRERISIKRKKGD